MLILSINVNKSRLAAILKSRLMTRVFGDPRHDLDSCQDEVKFGPEVDEQCDAGWPANFSNDPGDYIDENLYKSRDVLAYLPRHVRIRTRHGGR